MSSIDPNEDDVYFSIDWGNGTVDEWIGPFGSGEDGSATHSWNEEGTYEIRVKAKDIHGAESEWTTLEVNMTMNQHSIDSPLLLFLQKIIQRFPILEQILSSIQLLN
jgi:hypothetical protein